MVNLSEIQCVVMRYREPACEELSQWLYRMGVEWRYGISDYEIDVARNRNILRFLAEDVPRGKQYLLSINDDMVPIGETSPILTADGDLVYCASPGNQGTVDHYGDRQLSGACWRASARLLKSFGPPWFRLGHSGDLTERTYCDCNYFRDRCNDAGFDARMVGHIGHAMRCVLVPDPEDPSKRWRLVWPRQLDYAQICQTQG